MVDIESKSGVNTGLKSGTSFPSEIDEAFKKENDMSIETAWEHVQQWETEEKHEQAVSGAKEILKFVPDFELAQKVIDDQKKRNQAKENSSEIKKDADKKAGFNWGGDRIMGVISYFGPFFIIPLLFRRNSDFAQFHAKQGMLLFIFFWVFKKVALVIARFLVIPSFYNLVVGLTFIITVLAIYQAATGKKWKAPFVGTIAEKIKF